MLKSFEKFSFEKRERTEEKTKGKENEALELIKEIEEIQNKPEPEKTKEDYLEIANLAKKIERIFTSEKDPRGFWDWEIGKKLIVDWKKDYKERFDDCWPPHFSPDGEKIAALVKIGEKWTVAVDGKPCKEMFDDCWSPQFSPDGKNVAVIVKIGGKKTISVDGKPWEERFDDCWSPQFSPDGKKIMVVIKEGNKYYRLVKEV